MRFLRSSLLVHRHRLVACVALVALALAAPLSGSVVVAPTLDELAAEAESIFVGEVVDVRSRLVASRTEPTIVTDVVFSVERVLKGAPRVQARLEFLGGTVGDTRIEVVGVPRFRVGDRDVLFVEQETGRVSALVAIAHGRFRLMRDPASGRERVAYYDFRPLTDVATIGARAAERAVSGRAITLAQFEEAVRTRLARERR